jgi:AcrR family transcriptional regulator
MDRPQSSVPPAKRAILAESLRLFSTHGVDGVTVRDIAAASGFTNPALFRHFPSKEALAQDLYEECYRHLADILRDDSPRNFEEWLLAALKEIVRQPDAVNFVLEHLRRQFPGLPAELRKENLPSLVRRRIVRERDEGRLRASVDVPLAGVLVLGTLGQLARAAHFAPGSINAEHYAQAITAMLMHGIGMPTPGGVS